MSIIPTALGGGQRLDQLMMATDVFDTPGTSSWSHPSPGTALEVQVTLVGGAGGSSASGEGAAGNGTKTIWDVSGTPIIANSGSGAVSATDAGKGFIYGVGFAEGYSNTTIMNGLYGNSGHNYKTSGIYDFATGGSGYVKQFRTTVTSDVDIVVGSAGANTSPAGDAHISPAQAGAVIVQYAKAAVGIPAPVQKEFVEEWLDYDSTVGGSGTWIHPRPGQAITMTVICVGGSGGNADSLAAGTNGTNGTNTVFDSITALGGNGANNNTTTGVDSVSGGVGGSYITSTGSDNITSLGFGIFGAANLSKSSNNYMKGGTGGVKIGRITVTGNVSYTIGSGGTEGQTNYGNGLPGGIILKYSK